MKGDTEREYSNLQFVGERADTGADKRHKKNIAILGTTESSLTLKNLINNVHNPALEKNGKTPWRVAAFIADRDNVTPTIDDIPVLGAQQVRSFYKLGIIDAVAVTREVHFFQSQIMSSLVKLSINLDDVYLSRRINLSIVSDDNAAALLEPYFSSKYLSYLEFHIADHCILNCKACEHYSGLVKKPHFPNFKQFSADMRRLHEYIDDIGVIRILGGEPLLNPEINEYIKLSRALYPSTNIFVVTNGILLPQMPDEFFATLRSEQAGIHVSSYPPLRNKLEDLHNFLLSKQVNFNIGRMNEEFTCKQILTKHNQPREMFLNCYQAHCHNLYEGKIAACFLPFTTKCFNEYFGQNLPLDGAIDLYDPSMTTEKIKRGLNSAFARCAYCTPPVPVKWEQVKLPSVLSDWTHS